MSTDKGFATGTMKPLYKSALGLKDALKELFGVPFLLTAFILSIININQHNKCVNNDQKTFKEDTIVKLLYRTSIAIVIFACILFLLEYGPVVYSNIQKISSK